MFQNQECPQTRSTSYISCVNPSFANYMEVRHFKMIKFNIAIRIPIGL
ncbi:hypothetical protein pb186bvf_001279 [Paramecium bursaria]